MSKPTSIRTAIMLLYVRLAMAAGALAMNIRILAAPTEEELSKYKIDQLTSGQITFAIVNLLIPLVAAVMALWMINRKKRMPAILASLVLLWFSGTFIPIVEMVLAIAIVFLLFGRSARAYFSEPLLQAEPAGTSRIDVTPREEPSSESESAEPLPEPESAPAPRPRTDPVVEIRQAGPEDSENVHALMMEAFEEYRAAVPPSSALDETVSSVREDLEGGQGAAILYEDGKPAAMVRYRVEGNAIEFYRLSVIPSRRRRGYAKRLVRWIEQLGVSKGLDIARCKVRQTVQNNVTMYQDMGYEIVDQELVVRPAGTVKTLKMEKKLGVQ